MATLKRFEPTRTKVTDDSSTVPAGGPPSTASRSETLARAPAARLTAKVALSLSPSSLSRRASASWMRPRLSGGMLRRSWALPPTDVS